MPHHDETLDNVLDAYPWEGDPNEEDIGLAIRDMASDLEDESVIFLEPAEIFDYALIGLTEGHGPVRAIYDSDKCVEQLAKSMKENGEDAYENALEFFEFNTLGAYIENGPIFLRKPIPR